MQLQVIITFTENLNKKIWYFMVDFKYKNRKNIKYI